MLKRHEDVSGISGLGLVAWGVEWPDGSVTLRWNSDTPSTVVWDSVEAVQHIHGHAGATSVNWLD